MGLKQTNEVLHNIYNCRQDARLAQALPDLQASLQQPEGACQWRKPSVDRRGSKPGEPKAEDLVVAQETESGGMTSHEAEWAGVVMCAVTSEAT